MNERTEKYLATIDNLELLLDDEDRYYEELDLLWHSFSNEEVDWVEAELIKRKPPDAPQDLGMVDREVKVGESISPRVENQT